MDAEEAVGVAHGPSDVVPTSCHLAQGADSQRRVPVVRAPRRQGVERLPAQHVLAGRVLGVDDGAGAGDRDGLLDRAYSHLRVRRGRERR